MAVWLGWAAEGDWLLELPPPLLPLPLPALALAKRLASWALVTQMGDGSLGPSLMHSSLVVWPFVDDPVAVSRLIEALTPKDMMPKWYRTGRRRLCRSSRLAAMSEYWCWSIEAGAT